MDGLRIEQGGEASEMTNWDGTKFGDCVYVHTAFSLFIQRVKHPALVFLNEREVEVSDAFYQTSLLQSSAPKNKCKNVPGTPGVFVGPIQ